MTRPGNSAAAHHENWAISISVSQLPGFVACGAAVLSGERGSARCLQDVGQVVHVRQRALGRRLGATGHGQRARGGAGRALRAAQARQEERARAHRHRVRVLRVAGRHHALSLLRVLLGAQGRAVRATQGVSHSREANQHHTNAHMLYAPHRYVTPPHAFLLFLHTRVFCEHELVQIRIRDTPNKSLYNDVPCVSVHIPELCTKLITIISRDTTNIYLVK